MKFKNMVLSIMLTAILMCSAFENSVTTVNAKSTPTLETILNNAELNPMTIYFLM